MYNVHYWWVGIMRNLQGLSLLICFTHFCVMEFYIRYAALMKHAVMYIMNWLCVSEALYVGR